MVVPGLANAVLVQHLVLGTLLLRLWACQATVVRLAGWLVGWLAGWLVGWLVLAAWLVGWLVGKLVSRLDVGWFVFVNRARSTL